MSELVAVRGQVTALTEESQNSILPGLTSPDTFDRDIIEPIDAAGSRGGDIVGQLVDET